MGGVALIVAWVTLPVLSLATLSALASDPQFKRLVRTRRAVLDRVLHRRRRDAGPAGRPIEEIARDARRLGRQLRHPDDGRSQARISAIRLSYDDVLAEGCAALGMQQLLGVLPDGAELDHERRRVEVVLTGCGMVLEDVY